METGTSEPREGCDTEKNRLYYDPENLTIRGTAEYRIERHQYDVTQVRPNDNQNLEETETYELVNQ